MLQIQSFPRHQRDTKFTLRLCCLKWRHIFLVLESHSTLETCCKLCCWCWRHCWCWRWAIYCYVYFIAWALFVHALVEASKSGFKLQAAHSILPISPLTHHQNLKLGLISIYLPLSTKWFQINRSVSWNGGYVILSIWNDPAHAVLWILFFLHFQIFILPRVYEWYRKKGWKKSKWNKMKVRGKESELRIWISRSAQFLT